MKLIEAMKNLKTIEKRIQKNCEEISQYAAWVSVETPAFGTEDKQRQEVASRIQANLDLEKEYLHLKMSIEFTNLSTKVTIGDLTYTISSLITLKGKTAKDGRKLDGVAAFRTRTYLALNGMAASQRLQSIFSKGIDGANPPKLVCAYLEADKNKALREWEEFTSAIDGRLEVVNAETELLGY